METTEELNKLSDEHMEQVIETSEIESEIFDGTENEGTLIHNSADPEQIKKAENKLEIRGRQEISDLLWILSDVRGRRFIWKLLETTKPFVSGFQGDNNALQFFSGQRDIGKQLFLEIMGADSTAFGKMMTEFKGDIKNGKRKRRNES